MSTYEEACANPKMTRIDYQIVMRPFHVPLPGMEQQYHVYCSQHPEFGFCGSESEARSAALTHGNTHNEGAQQHG